MDPARIKFFRSIGIRTPLWPAVPSREAPPRLTGENKNRDALTRTISADESIDSKNTSDAHRYSNTNRQPIDEEDGGKLNASIASKSGVFSGSSDRPVDKKGDRRLPKGDGEASSTVEKPNRKAQEESWVFEMDIMPLKPKDDFRMNYLRKLSYANVWIPNSRKPPSHQTVTIFDWDDTLLCTSYINFHGDADDGHSSAKVHFDAIQRYGGLLLDLAMSLGHVFIITNAREGWVEYSSRMYLPNLCPILEKITIISARQHYEEIYPGDYHEWKVRAFISVRKRLNSQIVTNLISVGDSNIEMDAVHVMGKEFAQALIKTIKFREYPSPDELAKQLELVYLKFDRLCTTPRNLKIGLERKSNPSLARNQIAKPPWTTGSSVVPQTSATAASSDGLSPSQHTSS